MCFFFFYLSNNSNDDAGKKLLKDLTKINRPLEIKFDEMLKLMNQCDIVDKQNKRRIESRSVDVEDDGGKLFSNRQFKSNPFSLFSGIVPGKFYISLYMKLF